MVFVDFIGRAMYQIITSIYIPLPFTANRVYVIPLSVIFVAFIILALVFWIFDHLSDNNGADSFTSSDGRSG